MKVSIIIPVYNEAEHIEECMESLLMQTQKDQEIIFVDDGSTDDSPKKISAFLKKHKLDAIFLEQNHFGAGAARNLGVASAKGQILVFVDADMKFEPDFIEKLIDPIINGRSIGTFSKEEYLANSDNVWARLWNINRGLPKDRMHNPNYPPMQEVFRAIQKSAFVKAGGFDVTHGYMDDSSLSDKLGVKAINAPGAVFYHFNPSSLSEIFIQSKWMAKRHYKLYAFGYLVALLRTSFPVSIAAGVKGALIHSESSFIVFKIVADTGAFFGILEYLITKKVSK